MTTYTGRTLAPNAADFGGREPTTGTAHAAVALKLTGGPAPFIDRLGARALAQRSADHAGRSNDHGTTFLARLLAARSVSLVGFLAEQGARYNARTFRLSAFYRQGERITLSGYALNLAGHPLRQVNLQFIGQTVQDHFFGSSTNLDGVYVAFLEVGDTYTAYAFHPATGIAYKLERMEEKPNQTDLVFRQVTKRGGFGEGLFLQGDA